MAAAGKRGSRRRERRRGQLVGPVISVIAVLAVTVPVTVVMVRYSDGSRLTDLRAGRAPASDAAASRTLEPSRDGGARPDPFPLYQRSTQVVTPAVVPPPVVARTGGLPTTPTPDQATPEPSTPATSPTPSREPATPSSSRETPSPVPTTAPRSTATTPTPTRTPTGDPTSPSGPPPSSNRPAAYEAEVLRLTNDERASHGCDPLVADKKLAKAAGGHAEDMVARHYFDHTNPDGLGPAERVSAAGYSGNRVAENIAMGYPTPQAVVAGWMDSADHRANILDCDLDRLGVGFDPGRIADGYAAGSWVQNFGADN